MYVYVASSWRNMVQPGIVAALRKMGHTVYDFRHPAPGRDGFSWKDAGHYKSGPVDAATWRALVSHPVALQGYSYDIEALKACDVCVLVLPAGRSACFEMGYAMAQGKRGVVLALDAEVPDLMFREATICGTMDEFFDAFSFKG
jgi:hypothetical protein